MEKALILVLALIAVAACSLDIIPHSSYHGHGYGISSRFFKKAQGHGYGGYGLGYGSYGGYGFGGLGGYGGYRYVGHGGYGGFGYGYDAYL